MTPYQSNTKKSSGVTAFQIHDESIVVMFASKAYVYSYASAGKKAVEQMKKLAKAQHGLSTYISQHDPAYEKRS